MSRALTAKAVENLRPAAVRREIPDRTPLLYLVVQPSGRRRFVLRYRIDGTSRKVTLAAGLSLAAARKIAADAALDLERGVDPREARKAAKLKAAEARANTLAAIVAEYLKRDARLRTIGERERLLAKHVLPTLGDRPIASIRRGEIIRLLDRVEDGSGRRTADVVLSILRRVCNWHAVRDETFTPPFVRGMRRQQKGEGVRTRVLSDDELRRVWQAAETAGVPGGLIKLLLLTGARRSEAAALEWREIEGDVWTLPAPRNKTGAELARPVSRAALAVIDAQPRIVGCPYVFTLDGKHAIANFSDLKKRFDVACGVSDWHLHDLRRTGRSLLSRAGVGADIGEMCLGHVLPTIRRTYDQHRYLDEMRHAFEALAALIERIVDPPDAAVVVPLRGRP